MNPKFPRTFHLSWSEEITDIAKNVINEGHEGIVIRKSGSFDDYKNSTVKYVREGHVQTDDHWSNLPIKKNMVR